ncbi:maltodextrin glucosidase [Psychromonas ossibalaenae]|uniref:maltodextrin glucosidase n=1 Tax=Psychromonas ossibalaenae TaxID=444922 RepID=UPI00035C7F0D|nr:maltodextrin glucosidase [Psychromonas ossibalaenae]
MNKPFLYHGQDSAWLTPGSNSLQVIMVSCVEMLVSDVFIRCEPDNEEQLIVMRRGESKDRLQYWFGELPINSDKDITFYTFKVLHSSGQWWLHGCGISPRVPGKEQHFKYNCQHQPPAWVKEQVFYQIFPDRFANGNPEISVQSGEYCLRGEDRPTVAKEWGEAVSEHGRTGASEFFGGDLQGIYNKFDYLQELGVTALYLNPIFAAPSNHKYDTTDYLNIDVHLGTNALFAEMVEELHQRDMKIMLDAVYNHTSADHAWFDKYQRNSSEQPAGAYDNPASAYRRFYQFNGESNEYIGWNGIASLPKLNFSNPQVQDYIYAGDDAVIKHWLRPPYNIDAWRFDVIHMLGEGAGAFNNAHYVKAFRNAAKSVNSDCYVLGEHFFEASHWLQGDQEDGAMNYYGFSHPIRAFFAQKDISYHACRIDAPQLVQWLNEARVKLPWLNQLSQLNQLDSHDTMRFLSMVNDDTETMHLALLMLFAYVGTPCVYYGTEVELQGGQDPDNRRCFPWERTEPGNKPRTFALLKQLITLRKSSAALTSGSIQWLTAQEQYFAFARSTGSECYICVINNGGSQQTVDLPLWQLGVESGLLEDQLSGEQWAVKDGEVSLTLPAKQGGLLSVER